jgi:hypothetical protein
MENLIIFVCLTAGIAMLALLAQGTRIILKRAGFRFTARRLLPWILWAFSVLVVVSVTAFVALDGLAGDIRSVAVPVGAEDRMLESGPLYSVAPKAPYKPEEAEEESEEDGDGGAGGADTGKQGGPETGSRSGRHVSAGDTAFETRSGEAPQNPGAASEPGHRAYLFAYPDGAFRPEDGISRAETAIVFARLPAETGEAESEASRFAEVLRGSACGLFRPEARISRAEFVSICLRLAERRGLSERGWLDACAGGGPDFLPDGYITRAEVATIVNRMFGRGADVSYIRSHSVAGFRDVPTVCWAYPDIIEASFDHDFKMSDGKEVWLAIR